MKSGGLFFLVQKEHMTISFREPFSLRSSRSLRLFLSGPVVVPVPVTTRDYPSCDCDYPGL